MNEAALRLSIDTTDASPLEKDLLKRKLKKIIKRGTFNQVSPTYLYRYCCARFHLGDFSDYTGWEWRDYDGKEEGWAARLFFEKDWPIPRWDGGYVNRLWLLGEQGLGDEIFFASLIPEALARVKEIVYECDDRLHKIIERSFPRTVCVGRQGGDWTNRKADAYLPVGDLMRFFRRSVKHFPGRAYLKPDKEKSDSFSRYAGRIGVAWRGRQGSIDPGKFQLKHPLSVQYGERCDIESPDIDLKDDIDGLFSLVSVLWKVVTVPQSIQHIAGSIGKKVEIVLPEIKGEIINQVPWDYPVGRLPWYPDATVYKNIESWKSMSLYPSVPAIKVL